MRTFFLAALLLVAAPAFAAAPLTFEEVDTDGDGLISADEAASVEGLDFDAADGDSDGTLSVDEYEIAVEGLPPPSETAAPEEIEDAEDTAPEPQANPPKTPAPTEPPAKSAPATPATKAPPAAPAKP